MLHFIYCHICWSHCSTTWVKYSLESSNGGSEIVKIYIANCFFDFQGETFWYPFEFTTGFLRTFQNGDGSFIKNREDFLPKSGWYFSSTCWVIFVLDIGITIFVYLGFTTSENNYWKPAAELDSDKESLNAWHGGVNMSPNPKIKILRASMACGKREV